MMKQAAFWDFLYTKLWARALKVQRNISRWNTLRQTPRNN